MITDKELVQILKEACKKAGSQRKWALDNKISPAHVNDVINDRKGMTEKVAKALGYKFAGRRWVIKETSQK